MNKDLSIWLFKPQIFSHFMCALRFTQLTVHQSFLSSPVEHHFTQVRHGVQQKTPFTTYWHYIFLHSSLLHRIPSHTTSTHLSLPKLWPPSHQLSKAARICLNLHSRNCFQAESQGNYQVHFVSFLSKITVLCRLLSNVWKPLFQIFSNHNYLWWAVKSGPCCSNMPWRGNTLYLSFDKWNLLDSVL